MGEKDKKHKKDKKSKSKEHKKDRKHKHHRRHSSSSDSDDESDAEQQLQRERAAISKLRDILYLYPAVKKELREMLWRVDDGEAADVSGVPDPELKSQLAQFLELLKLKRNGKGVYGLSSKDQKVLPLVAFVFNEAPRPPAAAAQQPARQPQKIAEAGAEQRPREEHQREDTRSADDQATTAGVAAGPGPCSMDDAEAQAVGRPRGAVGPDAAPLGQRGDGGGGSGTEPAADEAAASPPAAPPPRRMAGPAMPPRELLEAAAAVAAAMEAAGAAGLPGDRGGDEDDGLLVGPPPPELVEELEMAPQDEREAEVIRIVKVLREHGVTPDKVDAYAVLGVEPAQPAGEVKKRYMRLSLLVHPDKCQHKAAHEAFQAVAISAKVLQDSGLRGALDARRQDAALRKMAEEEAARQERERAWKIARGEAVPEPAGPSGRLAGAARESWMTDLPPELSAKPGMPSQQSVRAFSQKGKTGRGDTTAWTDTPETRQAREAQQLLQAASNAYVQALPSAGEAGGTSGNALTAGASGAGGTVAAAMVDAFNTQYRKKSLMEVHMELQEKAAKEAKKAKKQKTAKDANGAAAGGGGNDAPDWPWKPFDREKDLEIRPKAKSQADMLRSAGNLTGKFSSAGGTRNFL